MIKEKRAVTSPYTAPAPPELILPRNAALVSSSHAYDGGAQPWRSPDPRWGYRASYMLVCCKVRALRNRLACLG
jgi:hypothetical protein